MSYLSIVTIDPDILDFKDIVLRQHASEVQIHKNGVLETCKKLALEMFELMYANDGAALAAPQAGISLRLVTIDPANLEFGPHVFINPVIKFASSTKDVAEEGCLSVPNYTGKVERPNKVILEAYNLKGELEEFNAEGWLARVFQHEVDHLEGILYLDRVKKRKDILKEEPAFRRRATAVMKKLL